MIITSTITAIITGFWIRRVMKGGRLDPWRVAVHLTLIFSILFSIGLLVSLSVDIMAGTHLTLARRIVAHIVLLITILVINVMFLIKTSYKGGNPFILVLVFLISVPVVFWNFDAVRSIF